MLAQHCRASEHRPKWLRTYKDNVCRHAATLDYLKVRMLSAARSFHYSRNEALHA